MKERGYAEAAPASERKPKKLATVTTRIMVTEIDDLYEDPDAPGLTIGQLIDRQFDRMMNPDFGGHPPEGWKPPEVYSVTVELPRGE